MPSIQQGGTRTRQVDTFSKGRWYGIDTGYTVRLGYVLATYRVCNGWRGVMVSNQLLDDDVDDDRINMMVA